MRIIENVRPDRQTVMFSATFPRQMEALARRILNKPIEIQVSSCHTCHNIQLFGGINFNSYNLIIRSEGAVLYVRMSNSM